MKTEIKKLDNIEELCSLFDDASDTAVATVEKKIFERNQRNELNNQCDIDIAQRRHFCHFYVGAKIVMKNGFMNWGVENDTRKLFGKPYRQCYRKQCGFQRRRL